MCISQPRLEPFWSPRVPREEREEWADGWEDVQELLSDPEPWWMWDLRRSHHECVYMWERR